MRVAVLVVTAVVGSSLSAVDAPPTTPPIIYDQARKELLAAAPSLTVARRLDEFGQPQHALPQLPDDDGAAVVGLRIRLLVQLGRNDAAAALLPPRVDAEDLDLQLARHAVLSSQGDLVGLKHLELLLLARWRNVVASGDVWQIAGLIEALAARHPQTAFAIAEAVADQHAMPIIAATIKLAWRCDDESLVEEMTRLVEQHHPGHPWHLVLQGRDSDHVLGQLQQAREQYSQFEHGTDEPVAVTFIPRHTPGLRALDDLLAGDEPVPDAVSDPRYGIEIIGGLLRLRRFAEAERWLVRQAQLDPSEWRVPAWRAIMAWQQDRNDLAVAELERAFASDEFQASVLAALEYFEEATEQPVRDQLGDVPIVITPALARWWQAIRPVVAQAIPQTDITKLRLGVTPEPLAALVKRLGWPPHLFGQDGVQLDPHKTWLGQQIRQRRDRLVAERWGEALPPMMLWAWQRQRRGARLDSNDINVLAPAILTRRLPDLSACLSPKRKIRPADFKAAGKLLLRGWTDAQVEAYVAAAGKPAERFIAVLDKAVTADAYVPALAEQWLRQQPDLVVTGLRPDEQAHDSGWGTLAAVREHVHRSEYDDAIAQLENLPAASYWQAWRFWVMAKISVQRHGDREAATRNLFEALTRQPDHVPSLVMGLEQAIEERAWDLAEGFLAQVPALVRDDPRLIELTVRLHAGTGKQEELREQLDAWLAKRPFDVDLLKRRRRQAVADEDWRLVRTLAYRSLTEQAFNRPAWQDLAKALKAMGESTTAIDALLEDITPKREQVIGPGADDVQ